jgi:large subunit ribosomal protein L25
LHVNDIELPSGIKLMTQGKTNPVIVSVSALSAEEEAAPIVVAAPAAAAGKGKKTEKQNKK